MDLETQKILKVFQAQIRIKNFVTVICYLIIIGGVFSYIFFSLSYKKDLKIASNYKDKIKDFKVEKVITNPRINFQYNEEQNYYISAKKASHNGEEEAVLFDVFAEGDLGKIMAGELEIKERGDHLVFSKNPILILNKIDKNK